MLFPSCNVFSKKRFLSAKIILFSIIKIKRRDIRYQYEVLVISKENKNKKSNLLSEHNCCV